MVREELIRHAELTCKFGPQGPLTLVPTRALPLLIAAATAIRARQLIAPALSRPRAQRGVQGAEGSSSLHAITCHYIVTH